MTDHRRFVLQAIDRSTECIARDLAFEVGELKELCEQICIDLSEFDPRLEYDLDPSDVDRITKCFELQFEVQDCRVSIRSWRPIDALPYKVHTNRELALMLAGTKPLAVFVGDSPPNPKYEEIPERLFEPYVRSGRFVKRDHSGLDVSGAGSASQRSCRTVLYAQPHEQWRIDAYLLMQETAKKSGWNEGFERMEGTLLGYTDWQNDAYLEMTRQIRSPSGVNCAVEQGSHGPKS